MCITVALIRLIFRVDNLVTCNAWKEMKNIAAEEGLIAIPYEQKYGQYR
jgi:hypothetical protein